MARSYSMHFAKLIWSWPGATLLLIAAMLPVWGPLLPPLEGNLFPVTSKVTFVDVTPVEDGSTLRMSYTKLRDCEFLGVTVDREGIPIEFRKADGVPVGTVATGKRLSDLWFIGTTDVTDLRLRWIHRCSPFWVTITVGYP